MNLVHLHLLLNHVPTIGTAIGVALLAIGVFGKSEDVRRASLAVLFGIALMALPTYMTGYAAQSALAAVPDISTELIDQHQREALLALIFVEITGMAAWFALWTGRRRGIITTGSVVSTLALALITLALMAQAANVGGEIRHPEIVAEGASAATEQGLTLLQTNTIAAYVANTWWVWPVCETLHFIGLSLLAGVVLLLNFRMFGWIPRTAFMEIHRLLPVGVWAFFVNTTTGFIFFIAVPGQYVDNVAFQWKIVALLLAGASILYFTLFETPWKLGPNDQAPFAAKLAALSSMVFWVGVIYFGRMLPFLGDSF